MYRSVILWLLPCVALSHELTPTYPELRPAYLDGLLVTTMTMFNSRPDVDYYEVGVFDEQWNPLNFATTEQLLHLSQGEGKTFDVYIRASDQNKAFYICTTSKLLSDPEHSNAVISSKVCSRIKK